MVADKSISPVDALMLNPAVELNVPPVVPAMLVGVESQLPDTQYSADGMAENVPSSSSVMVTSNVPVTAHKLLDVA